MNTNKIKKRRERVDLHDREFTKIVVGCKLKSDKFPDGKIIFCFAIEDGVGYFCTLGDTQTWKMNQDNLNASRWVVYEVPRK